MALGLGLRLSRIGKFSLGFRVRVRARDKFRVGF